jgi:hypothetical protein
VGGTTSRYSLQSTKRVPPYHTTHDQQGPRELLMGVPYRSILPYPPQADDGGGCWGFEEATGGGGVSSFFPRLFVSYSIGIISRGSVRCKVGAQWNEEALDPLG